MLKSLLNAYTPQSQQLIVISTALTKPCKLLSTSLYLQIRVDYMVKVNIRSFYTQYMSERYLVNEWPFDNIDEDALVELIKIFSPNFLDNLSFSQLRNIKLAAGV